MVMKMLHAKNRNGRNLKGALGDAFMWEYIYISFVSSMIQSLVTLSGTAAATP